MNFNRFFSFAVFAAMAVALMACEPSNDEYREPTVGEERSYVIASQGT